MALAYYTQMAPPNIVRVYIYIYIISVVYSSRGCRGCYAQCRRVCIGLCVSVDEHRSCTVRVSGILSLSLSMCPPLHLPLYLHLPLLFTFLFFFLFIFLFFFFLWWCWLYVGCVGGEWVSSVGAHPHRSGTSSSASNATFACRSVVIDVGVYYLYLFLSVHSSFISNFIFQNNYKYVFLYIANWCVE